MKRTKIVCTIGPASDKKSILKQLIKNGMNVARLNFSHNVYAYHEKVIKSIRELAKELDTPVCILQDLQGPRIRLGELPEKGVNLKRGGQIILTTETADVNGKKVLVNYKNLAKELRPNERVLIADGKIELKVIRIVKNDIHCQIVMGGTVFSHKGMNFPDSRIKISSITNKDKLDLYFGINRNVDMVALSFVRNAEDVYYLRTLIRRYEKKLGVKNKQPLKIVVKIERKEAIQNIDKIIEATDAVMVARGDLGIEMPAEDVPLLQKMIIDKCLKAAKPVIVATEMLDSMINNPRPTRAEVSDVANAVIDHTDAVMLSGESAAGKFPVAAVKMMNKIIEKTEDSTYDNLVVKEKIKKMPLNEQSLSRVVKLLSESTESKLILCASINGRLPLLLNRYRPEMPIVIGCLNERLVNQLTLSWGIRPFLFKNPKMFSEQAKKFLLKNKFVKKGDQIILINNVLSSYIDKISAVEVGKI